jgi:hypothetical protein
MAAVGMAELSLIAMIPVGPFLWPSKCCDTFRWQTRLSGPPHSSSP